MTRAQWMKLIDMIGLENAKVIWHLSVGYDDVAKAAVIEALKPATPNAG